MGFPFISFFVFCQLGSKTDYQDPVGPEVESSSRDTGGGHDPLEISPPVSHPPSLPSSGSACAVSSPSRLPTPVEPSCSSANVAVSTSSHSASAALSCSSAETVVPVSTSLTSAAPVPSVSEALSCPSVKAAIPVSTPLASVAPILSPSSNSAFAHQFSSFMQEYVDYHASCHAQGLPLPPRLPFPLFPRPVAPLATTPVRPSMAVPPYSEPRPIRPVFTPLSPVPAGMTAYGLTGFVPMPNSRPPLVFSAPGMTTTVVPSTPFGADWMPLRRTRLPRPQEHSIIRLLQSADSRPVASPLIRPSTTDQPCRSSTPVSPFRDSTSVSLPFPRFFLSFHVIVVCLFGSFCFSPGEVSRQIR